MHILRQKCLITKISFVSPIDEAGPFGSDSGSDAAAGFNQRRTTNKTESPIKYLSDLLLSWGFPLFDWNELDPVTISEYIQIKANIGDMSQHIDQMKEVLKNSPGMVGIDVTDQSLQEIILKSAEVGGTYSIRNRIMQSLELDLHNLL